jgi:hypothetical protein
MDGSGLSANPATDKLVSHLTVCAQRTTNRGRASPGVDHHWSDQSHGVGRRFDSHAPTLAIRVDGFEPAGSEEHGTGIHGNGAKPQVKLRTVNMPGMAIRVAQKIRLERLS